MYLKGRRREVKIYRDIEGSGKGGRKVNVSTKKVKGETRIEEMNVIGRIRRVKKNLKQRIVGERHRFKRREITKREVIIFVHVVIREYFVLSFFGRDTGAKKDFNKGE